MSAPKVRQIPSLQGIKDPEVKRVLEAMAERIRAIEGAVGNTHRRPTVNEMIAAGITNADEL